MTVLNLKVLGVGGLSHIFHFSFFFCTLSCHGLVEKLGAEKKFQSSRKSGELSKAFKNSLDSIRKVIDSLNLLQDTIYICIALAQLEPSWKKSVTYRQPSVSDYYFFYLHVPTFV